MVVSALLIATLTCALLAWWAGAIGSSPSEVGVVTRPVLTEATREAWLLAHGLARRGVPTGLIAPRKTSAETRDPTLAAEPTADVLARFNRGNGEFAAIVDDGVVHIRRRDRSALIDGLLARSSQQGEAKRTMRPPLGLGDVGELVDEDAPVAYALGSVLNATGGLLWKGVFEDGGSVGSYLGGRPPCLDLRVRVDEDEISPLSVLDAIARQHPDIFWIVTYDPDGTASADDLRVGVVCSGGGSASLRSGRSH